MAMAVQATIAAIAGSGVHEEGDGHEQRGRHRGRQPRDRAEE